MSEDFQRPEVEVNTFKKSSFLTARVLENRTLVEGVDDADVRHIVLDTDGYTYLEGQSAGVLAPGMSEKGKPHAVRLYSIASIGNDLADQEKLSLCVKRLVYNDPDSGEEKRGVASNFLCDAAVGDEVHVTGPAGRKFLLPVADDMNRPYVFIATGTGIAPFRAMIERLLLHTPGFDQPIYLFFGCRRQAELLYDEEFKKYEQSNFHYLTARSREQKNKEGERYYVYHLMADHLEELTPIIQNERSLIYICGLKGMEVGIEEVFEKMADSVGESKEDFRQRLDGRILTEVY